MGTDIREQPAAFIFGGED